jgi:NAD(P)H-hydrate epimerase
LVAQLDQLKIPVVDSLPEESDDFDVCLDGIFGFSFKGDVRAPFDSILSVVKVGVNAFLRLIYFHIF